jgi:glycosyltransferase involved in cell wall biosynthesis
LGLRNSVKLIVPSKTVKEQIISYYGEKFKDKIEVIYEGVSYHLLEEKKEKQTKKEFPYKNFFLYVGNFYPHKNVENLIEAFSSFDKKYSLVLVGQMIFYQKS